MLKIRDAQMRVFSQALADSAERALVEYVIQRFPRLRDEAALLARAARAKASTYGLTSLRDHQHLVDLCAEAGVDFDDRPDGQWMRSALQDTSVTAPSERLRAVLVGYRYRVAIGEFNRRIHHPSVPTLPEWAR